MTLARMPDSKSTRSDAVITKMGSSLLLVPKFTGRFGSVTIRQAVHAPDHLLGVDVGEDAGGVHRGVVNWQEWRALLLIEQGQEPAPASRVHHDHVRRQKPCRTDTFVNAPVRTIPGQEGLAIQLIDQSPITFDDVSQMGREELDRHSAVVGRRVTGAPNLTHAAAAQQLDQPVATERRPVRGLTVNTEQLGREAIRSGHRRRERRITSSSAASTATAGTR
jgi:hypothetical protein